MRDPNVNWLRTNELEEFIGALEFTAEVLASVRHDPVRWKWVIIALHNAVQGAFVCSIRGADTTGIAVLDKATGAAMWQWLDVTSRSPNPPPPPKEKLANFLDLYKRAGDATYLPNPLPRNGERDERISKLNSLRNEFIHFVPKGLSIELSGMPEILGHAQFCIRHLAISSPTFEHHFRGGERQRIQNAVDALGI